MTCKSNPAISLCKRCPHTNNCFPLLFLVVYCLFLRLRLVCVPWGLELCPLGSNSISPRVSIYVPGGQGDFEGLVGPTTQARRP